jgi:hypothetical protein
MVIFSFLMVGCPTPDSYIKSSELALENSINLDKNIETVSSNYFNFIFKDTERLVKNNEMGEETRQKILKNAREQVVNLKEQSLLNREFVKLAHDWVHSKGLKSEEILSIIKTINEATPEVLDFVDKLKKD